MTANSGFEALGIALSMTVKDLEASAAWYTDVMGFKKGNVYERDGQVRAVEVTAGPARILLNQDDGAKGWDRIKGQGINIQFQTTQNIDDVANRIKAAGGTLGTEPADMPWGARVFRMTDPDGYNFNISTPRG